MQIAYPHIAGRLFGRPHAIEPVALRAIMDGPLARRVLSGETVGSGKVKKGGRDLRRARLATVAGATQVREGEGLIEYALTADGIAVIPIAGVLSQRFDWFAAMCGWTTYEGLEATLASAVDSGNVRGILLDVDTPGGEASGMLDAADAILAARDKKPCWAVANSCAASAGYALAASAEKLIVPRLAVVGSIGCVLVHVDQSVQDAASGLKFSAVYSGARKIDGWAHAPLSDDARSSAQADVDHVRDAFAALVGRQGRIGAKAALATEAAMFADDAAVKAGLADAVMSFDAALAAMTAQTTEAQMGKTTSALRSTTSAAAIAAGAAQPAAAADATAQPTAAAAAAAPGASPPSAKKVVADMTPPKAGEKCTLCGQTMPDDDDNDAGDENGNGKEQETHAPGALVPAASGNVILGEPQYTAKHAEKTVELCTIAGKPQLAAAFIKAQAPLKKVRADLLRRASEAAGEEISAARAPDVAAEARMAAAWDDVVGKLNAEHGHKK